MNGYDEFQRILAEIKAKIATHENQVPPGFEELFRIKMTEFERIMLNQIINRIKKIEDKQKEQNKKIEQLEVKLASMGFPVNLFK